MKFVSKTRSCVSKTKDNAFQMMGFAGLLPSGMYAGWAYPCGYLSAGMHFARATGDPDTAHVFLRRQGLYYLSAY